VTWYSIRQVDAPAHALDPDTTENVPSGYVPPESVVDPEPPREHAAARTATVIDATISLVDRPVVPGRAGAGWDAAECGMGSAIVAFAG
jgi:hypothetical protein